MVEAMKGSDERRYDVIVVGGGAAGMMAAGRAATRGKRVLLLEKNKKLGAKLAITGGGRCNITNAEEDERVLLEHYGEAKDFLHSPFSQFGVKDTFEFFGFLGLPIVVQANKRAFPKSEKALDVVRVLARYMAEGNVEVKLGVPVESVRAVRGRIEAVTALGKEFKAESFIFATGGLSHPETGSTGDGFEWLRELGHAIERPTPTIVPLRSKDPWVKALAGVTFPGVKITFSAEGASKKVVRRGSVLFTHFGISGPTILNAAGAVADLLYEGAVTASIDMYPDENIGSLDKRITGFFDEHKNKTLKNAFREIVPAGAAETLLSLIPGIDPDIKVHSVTKENRRRIVDILKRVPLSIAGLMGYDRAVVADGGVHLTDIDMRTMRSRHVSNLFVTGDLLHITRPSGGYSLQLCWTTGFVAGNNA